VRELTSISVAGEVAGPGDERLALVLTGGDGVCADGGDDGRVRELGLSRDDAVRDEVVDALRFVLAGVHVHVMEIRTECSSCLTSTTAPSLKVHLTTSASSEVPLTQSLFSRAVQNLLKSWSLIRCQTSLKGASMTADSLTDVEVGMRPDMMSWMCDWRCGCGGVEVMC
jgi:hypothetical protein